MEPVIATVINILRLFFAMTWEVGWALILGFLLSGLVQAVVSKHQIQALLPKASLRGILTATGLGAASSSCSYAAAALSRSLFSKGADFTCAIVFEFASTNLVFELGAIMLLLLGWQFALAEFVGGGIMIVLLTLLFRLFLKPALVAQAQAQALRGAKGSMEGHALMDMSVGGGGRWWKRALSGPGYTATAHYFVMDWAAVYKDVFGGLMIAAILGTVVPDQFWQSFFLTDHPALAALWGPLIGPLVSMLSFVCSIGNVPLAAVLWGGGISFGGVISFIFADLLIFPILNIYRKYYGWKMMLFLATSSYAAMVGAGYLVERLFTVLNIIPARRTLEMIVPDVSWNYSTVLNLIFIGAAIALTLRAFKTGVGPMLQMMEALPEEDATRSNEGEYSCPMHADVRGGSADDSCPRCGMRLQLPN